jgi:hypothetical protein
MSTRFFTNQGDQTLLGKLRDVSESNADIEWFDALVGYLRASGYFCALAAGIRVPGADRQLK